jgi:hypothetical protein
MHWKAAANFIAFAPTVPCQGRATMSWKWRLIERAASTTAAMARRS